MNDRTVASDDRGKGLGLVESAGTGLDADARRLLYYDMLRIRRVEERIVDLYPEQEMRCPVHLSIGQEAAAVGACAPLAAADYVLSGHRAHAHYLAKGGNLDAMLAEIYGKATGCTGGKGGSMHPVDLSVGFLGAAPIVGSTIAIAAGVAFATAMRGENRVTMVFLGDGATETGTLHETLNFALLETLPLVLVCENNLYSVNSPLPVRQPSGRAIVDLASGHGMESHAGDGNDVLAVHALAGRAVENARAGDGPTFIELATYRWREHCGPNYDNDLGYRGEAEYLAWRERCPVDAFRGVLAAGGDLDDADDAALDAAIAAEIDAAVDFAKTSPFPDPAAAFDHVFAGQDTDP